MKTIIINSKKHGIKQVFIDDEYFDVFNKYKWTATTNKKSNTFYATRNDKDSSGKKIKISMHRIITNCNDGFVVDHIDHNGLNNQKNNLRICTISQNGTNRHSDKNATSKYLGVSWDKIKNKWVVFIKHKNRNINLGRYASEIEAALVYDANAKIYFGIFASLNYDKMSDEEKKNPSK